MIHPANMRVYENLVPSRCVSLTSFGKRERKKERKRERGKLIGVQSGNYRVGVVIKKYIYIIIYILEPIKSLKKKKNVLKDPFSENAQTRQ